MEELRKLKLEYQELLEQYREDIKALVLCAINDESEEYCNFKAEINKRNWMSLKHFYISVARKCLEQRVILYELKEQNGEKAKIDEAQKLAQQYTTFVNNVKKESGSHLQDGEHKQGIAFMTALFNEIL